MYTPKLIMSSEDFCLSTTMNKRTSLPFDVYILDAYVTPWRGEGGGGAGTRAEVSTTVSRGKKGFGAVCALLYILVLDAL